MEKKAECEIVQDLLFSYVDDVLNPASKQMVEKHLMECEDCKSKLEKIKKETVKSKDNIKKEIDYLKKVKIKSRVKSILMAIGILFLLCLILYLNKFIKINGMMNQAEQLLASNNFYKETTQILSSNETSVVKEYYKDGKYKRVAEIYSDDGVKVDFTEYATVNSDERILINEENNVTIQKGLSSKLMNAESAMKNAVFVQNQNLWLRLGTAFVMSMKKDNYDIGREYYVLRNQFEQNQRWELWLDKETGLPLKEINREAVRLNYANGVVKDVRDIIREFRYEFDIVTEEDVEVPDLGSYNVSYYEEDEEGEYLDRSN